MRAFTSTHVISRLKAIKPSASATVEQHGLVTNSLSCPRWEKNLLGGCRSVYRHGKF